MARQTLALAFFCCCMGGCACFTSEPRSLSSLPPVPSEVALGPVAIPQDMPEGIGPPAAPASVIPVAASERSIDLPTALELAGAENATIALAREAVRASLALELQARALALPSLDAGANLNEHWGNLQSAGGIIENVQRQALYFGNGAGAVGAGTVGAPGVRLVAHVADALYAPVTAREEVAARRFDAAAVRNLILLDVVKAYFGLMGAEAKL